MMNRRSLAARARPAFDEYGDARIFAVWQRLAAANCLLLRSRCRARSRSGWRGRAVGDVVVERGDHVIRFNERAMFRPAAGATNTKWAMSNCYCWRLKPKALELAHERRGRGAAVHLATFVPDRRARLISREDHVCGRDRYAAAIACRGPGLRLIWRVVGPAKNETLVVDYRMA